MVLTGGMGRGMGLGQQLATHSTREGLSQARQQLVKLCPAITVLRIGLHDQPTSGHVEVGGVHYVLSFIHTPEVKSLGIASISRGATSTNQRQI